MKIISFLCASLLALSFFVGIPNLHAEETIPIEQKILSQSPFELIRKLTWKLRTIATFELPYDAEGKEQGIGTAFWINGLLVSCSHTVNFDDYIEYNSVKVSRKIKNIQISIEHEDFYGKTFELCKVEDNSSEDICTLKLVNDLDYKTLSGIIELSKQLKIGYPNLGEDIYIFGYPLGFGPVLQNGLISQEIGDIKSLNPKSFVIWGFLQRGVSGSPIFKVLPNFEVIGVAFLSSSLLTNLDYKEALVPFHLSAAKKLSCFEKMIYGETKESR